jgi:CheY-like chemotaxis protein
MLRDKVVLSTRPTDIGEVLANAIEVSASLIEQKRHTLRLDVPTTPALVVDVDAARMTQVFSNLLNNAAKYTDGGGEIRVRAGGGPGDVFVAIEDTGLGIEPGMLKSVFELFTQGLQSRERALGGFGVGLAVAKRLVTAHGGTITAESAGPGLGSRFTVRLPRAVVADEVSDAAPSHAAAHAPVRRRVLIVDDNEDSREMVATLLAQLGHEVRTAPDGGRALEIAQEFSPDIAFLDIGLPGMTGYVLAQRLRQTPACAAIPIIAISGYARDADRQEAIAAGFTEHFAKPIDPARLEELVEHA